MLNIAIIILLWSFLNKGCYDDHIMLRRMNDVNILTYGSPLILCLLEDLHPQPLGVKRVHDLLLVNETLKSWCVTPYYFSISLSFLGYCRILY